MRGMALAVTNDYSSQTWQSFKRLLLDGCYGKGSAHMYLAPDGCIVIHL